MKITSFLGSLIGSQQSHRAKRRGSMSASSLQLRRELVGSALRDTLIRHGIPTDWIGADVLFVRDERGDPNCYVYMVVQHWQPTLVAHAGAFEQSFLKRLHIFDASSRGWMKGLSWKFDLPHEQLHDKMPAPATWRAVQAEPFAIDSKPPGLMVAPEAAERSKTSAHIRNDQLEALRELLARNEVEQRGAPVDFQNTMPFEHEAEEAR